MTAIATDTDAQNSSTVEQLVQAVNDLQQTVEQQAERIDELETELADHKDHSGREVADVRARISELEDNAGNVRAEDGSEPATPECNGDETGSQNAETPMERIIRYSEDAAKEHLSANATRARFIAKDVTDYARKVPAGRVIDSSTIRKVVKAKEGKRPHTQTVARIMDFLADLGKDVVELKKRRGRKLVVFDEDAVDRFTRNQGDAAGDHGRCDQRSGPTPSGSVIQPG